ncbi:CAT RNA binding domain-containing protein [Collinsella aerofaciens]|uniref:CAT RNA binding domain-containing protein n=1 Tax=Collinsella aerofaciens TaxID=74426 RepID=UPI001896E5A6|nr:CAT RNA binding domain-containing protein [Collinsella aerofaciens]MDB1871301.1 CAT RNA binding domain-containing protein [Collinsella aerofaciens]
MEIVKRINTSAVLCIDGNGRQLVAFGRGLGFKDVGDELPLSEIQRTFYNAVPATSLSLMKSRMNFSS